EWVEDIVVDVGSDERAMGRSLPLIRSAKELLLSPPPKPPEIIVGLLHQGCKMVLGGASKTNKTWVLTDLAISVATGAAWWDFATTQGDVLYVNLELGEAFFAERIKLVAAARDIDPPGGWMSGICAVMLQTSIASGQRSLTEWVSNTA